MKFKIGIILICTIIPGLVIAAKCKPPKDTYCSFFSPDTTYIGIKINFKRDNPNQIVYLDGGCILGIVEFTPKQRNIIDKHVKEKDISLNFTFCRNDEFINKQMIEITSDSKIICDVTDKLKCTKIKD